MHLANCIYICYHMTLPLPCSCTFVLRISPLQAQGLFSDLCFSLVGKAGLLNHDFLPKETYSIRIFLAVTTTTIHRTVHVALLACMHAI